MTILRNIVIQNFGYATMLVCYFFMVFLHTINLMKFIKNKINNKAGTGYISLKQNMGQIPQSKQEGSIELPILEKLQSVLEKSLIDQSELLSEIDNRLYRIKVSDDTTSKEQEKRPSPIDFAMKANDLMAHLYDNNQRLHKIINHLSQII